MLWALAGVGAAAKTTSPAASTIADDQWADDMEETPLQRVTPQMMRARIRQVERVDGGGGACRAALRQR
jgi:hypothetical protein